MGLFEIAVTMISDIRYRFRNRVIEDHVANVAIRMPKNGMGMHKRNTIAAPLIIAAAIVTITGCSVKPPMSTNDVQPSTSQTANADSATDDADAPPPTEVADVPANPPVQYEPAWPDKTVTSSSGHLVNSCVPEEFRDHATTLTTRDGIFLSALVLGSGTDGVLLDHEQGYSICSFLDIGAELAERGYLVVIPEYRSHGASQKIVKDGMGPIDLDAEAALDELKRHGAERVFLAGASCGGTTAITAGVRQQLPIGGLLILSSPARCAALDAVPSVKQVDAPSLFIASTGDMLGAIEKQVRELYEASGSDEKELIILENGYHGTDMYHRGNEDEGAALRSRIIKFITSAFD